MTTSDQEEKDAAPRQQEEGETSSETSSPPTPPKETKEQPILQDYYIEHYLFPSKLWRILDEAEKHGYADVISWVDDGTAFQIHDREKVVPILKKRFHVSKYKSFLRQLQAYKFRREAPNKGDRDGDRGRGKWKHDLFRRDKANWCTKIKREETNKARKANSGSSSSSSSSSAATGLALKGKAAQAAAVARASLHNPAAHHHHPHHPLFSKYHRRASDPTTLAVRAPTPTQSSLPPALAWNQLAGKVLQRRPSSAAGMVLDTTTSRGSASPVDANDPYAEELALLERRKRIILEHRRLQQEQKAQKQQQQQQNNDQQQLRQQQQEQLQKQEDARKRVLLAHQRVLKEAQLCRDLEVKKIDFAMLCAKMKHQDGHSHLKQLKRRQQQQQDQLPPAAGAPLRDHKSELLKRESELIRALKARQQSRGVSALSSLAKLPTTTSSSLPSSETSGMVLRNSELTRAALHSQQQLALQQRQRQIVSSALDVVTGVTTASSSASKTNNDPSQLVASALDVVAGVVESSANNEPSQLVSCALDVINGVPSSSKRTVRSAAPQRSSVVTGVMASVTKKASSSKQSKKHGAASKRSYSKKMRGAVATTKPQISGIAPLTRRSPPRKRWLSSATITTDSGSTTPVKSNLSGGGVVRARGSNIASLLQDLDKAFQPAGSALSTTALADSSSAYIQEKMASSRLTGMLPVTISPEQRQQQRQLRLLSSRMNNNDVSSSSAESRITREEMLKAAVAEKLEQRREEAAAAMRNTGVVSSLIGRGRAITTAAEMRGGEVSDDSATEGSTTPTISNKTVAVAEEEEDDVVPGALEQFAATAMLGLAR